MVQPGLDSVAPSAPGADVAGPSVEPMPPAPESTERASGTIPIAPGIRHPWGIVSRSLALCALLGMAIVYFVQFSISADWLTLFIEKNELEMPRRMVLIGTGAAGAALFVAMGAVILSRAWLAGVPLGRVERWLWVVSPLMVLPAVPLFFEARAWTGHYQTLLTVLVPVLFTLEVLVTRSVAAFPDLRPFGSKIAERLPQLWKKHGPLAVVSLAVVAYALFMSFYLVRWHMKIQTHNFDLSINNNLVYGGLKGVFMHGSVSHGADPAAYLAAHAKYGAYLFLPIYALYPHPETLLVIQSLLLALGALPLFGFARRYVSPWIAVVVSLAYLAYHPLHAANFCELNFLQTGVFFVIATAWAAERERWVWLWLAFVCGISMREDMPIGFAVLGTVFLLTGYRPRTGLVMAAVSSVWFVILRFVIMQRVGNWWFPEMYKELWAPGEQGFSSVLETLVTNPLFVLDKIITKDKVGYVLHLLVPLAFLPARRWWLWAAFVPGTIVTLLVTSYGPPTDFAFHYVLHWVPYLFLAVPLALASIRDFDDAGGARMVGALVAFGFAMLVTSFNYGAFARRESTFKGGYNTISFAYTNRDAQRYAELKQIIALIPRDASVSATENVGPHVSSRLYIYAMRYGTFDAQYLLAAKGEIGLGDTKKYLSDAVKKNYGVVRRIGDFVLLERGHDQKENPALIRDFKL